jgi:Right handed beta helix region
MRNIRFAPRSELVTNLPPAPRPSRRSRKIDVLATIPILLLIPALILPFAHAAGGATGAGDVKPTTPIAVVPAAGGKRSADPISTGSTARSGGESTPPAPTSAPASTPRATAPAAPAPAATTAPAPTAAPSPAQTFYVATTGSDGNNGSVTAPWRTFSHAAATVPAGATVLGRAGTYGPFTISRSGKSGNPTRFAAYPGESVTIAGNSSRSNVILVTGAHDIVLDRLIVTGAPTQYGAGVRIEEGSYRVTIERSTLRENRSFGIKIADSTDVKVKSNNIAKNETGIEISRAGSGVVIDGNRIHDNDRMVTSSRGGNGIVFHLTTGQIQVTRNQLYGNRARHLSGSGYDGGAFEVYGASNLVITGNVLWNNNNAMETGTDGTPCSNNRFTRNIVRGLGSVAGETTGMILRCASKMLVAHNTFDGLDDYAFYLTDSGSFAASIHDLRIIDNIVVHGRAFSLDTGLPADVSIDYNLVSPGGSTATYSNYIAYVQGFGNTDSLAELRSWTGYEMHGIKAAPDFVDASGGDYRLRSQSPAIDAGVSYGEGYAGTAPDVGRYEWSG